MPTIIDPIHHKVMLEQIGTGNWLAISGARLVRIDDMTIELPVAYGYSVRITYRPVPDCYTVQRIYRRGTKTWVKAEAVEVYCDNLGEVAYRASCYRDPFDY